jgi:hypothetical protein
MTEPKAGFWRRFPLPVVAAAVMVVAIGVGIPVGLAAGAGSPQAEPTASLGPTSTETVSEVATPTDTYVPTSDPTTESPEPTESTTSPESTEDTVEPPSGLSSPERDLWDEMEMNGVDHQSCRGYPDGEQLDGVVAALECDIEDPSISEPIVYYQFDSATSVADYMSLRGQEVDRVGQCENGDEAEGNWTVNGASVGSYVCVDNVKDGETYFKIAFSDASDDTVAVVQDESVADVYAWWREYAAGQFYGVGEN